MGIKDFWNALTGKTAEIELIKTKSEAEALITALENKNKQLEAENANLKSKNTEFRDAVKKRIQELEQERETAVENAFKNGQREKEKSLQLESWTNTNLKGLPKQEQMAKFLKHLVYDPILPKDENKTLAMLQELMKSESVDIMKPEDESGLYSLLEKFLMSFEKRDIRGKEDFFRRVFKVILNANGKNGPKADLTSSLPDNRAPLINYFGAYESLQPFFETVVDSAAFDMKNFDGDRFRDVVDAGDENDLQLVRILFSRGYEPEKDQFVRQNHFDGSLSWWQHRRRTVGGDVIKQPKKKITDELQQRLNRMSPRELLKALQEGILHEEVKVVEEKPVKKAPSKKKTAPKAPTSRSKGRTGLG